MAQNGRPRRVISFNNIGALNFMSGLRARSACVAMMLAAFTPLLAGCDESSSAISAAQPNDPDVSIVIVKTQPRAVVREPPARPATTPATNVPPRVSASGVEGLFRQGNEVKAGDPLYRIDPPPLEVEV